MGYRSETKTAAAMLTDFGMFKHIDRADVRKTHEDGRPIDVYKMSGGTGSYLYMAPEVRASILTTLNAAHLNELHSCQSSLTEHLHVVCLHSLIAWNIANLNCPLIIL